jgi:hypothetical protein
MLITLGTASAQQPLRPELILRCGAPQEVNAQPNFVMAQPRVSYCDSIPVHHGREALMPPLNNRRTAPTLLALTSRFPLAPTPLGPPVIKTNNFNGHSETKVFSRPTHMARLASIIFVEVTNSHFDVFSKASPMLC